MMKQLEIKYMSVNDIKPYKNNPRINEKAIPYVMNSIKEFGFKNPIIIDKNNIIICGHTRLESAKRLKYTEVPVIYADDLSDEQIKAFRLADNKVSEISEWDLELLDNELSEIDLDMEQFGFLKEIEEVNEELGNKPEVEFTEVLGEEHNYIVLYFDNEVDWLQAESLFDIKPKMNLSTKKDGKIAENMKRTSVGRVLNGAKALEKLRCVYEH